MDYSSYAEFDTKPPFYGREHEAYYDEGQGVPKLNENNMTIQDVYRTPFLFNQDHIKDYKTRTWTAIRNTHANTELSKIFFSDKNMIRLQKMIKKEVYRRTNGKYKLDVDQEERDLLIVMRAVYLEYGRYLPGQIVRQVKRLNQRVLEEVMPSLLTELKQYYGYLHEINGPLKPIARPLNMSHAGRRTLPSITTVWGIDTK